MGGGFDAAVPLGRVATASGKWEYFLALRRVSPASAPSGGVHDLVSSDGTPGGTRRITSCRGGRRIVAFEDPDRILIDPNKPFVFKVSGSLQSNEYESVWVADLRRGSCRRLLATIRGRYRYIGRQGGKIHIDRYRADLQRGELYAIDERSAAVRRVFRPWGSSWYSAEDVAIVRNRFLFKGYSPATGSELWISDGTPAGTRLLKDIAPGAPGSEPGYFVEAGTKAYFWTAHPRGFWITDGTPPGTTRLAKDLVLSPWQGVRSSREIALPLPGGELVFTGYRSDVQAEPFVTDGTAAGTHLIENLMPGGDGDAHPIGFRAGLGGVFFFGRRYDTWRNLYFADPQAGPGGPLGPTFYDPGSPRGAVTTLGERLIFDTNGSPAPRLWTSDGTAAGTRPLAYLSSLVGERPILVGRPGTETLVIGERGALWRTDGTPGSPVYAGSLGRDESSHLALPTPRRCWFLSYGKGSVGLWKLEAGAESPDFIREVGGSLPAPPWRCFQRIGSRVVFQVREYGKGYRLWSSDGTTRGTVPIATLPGPVGADPDRPPLVLGGRLHLWGAPSPAGLRDVWATDGTAQGTKLAFSIPASKAMHWEIVATKSWFLCTGSDALHGEEPWLSDGTQRGTRLLADLSPGPAGSFPRYMAAIGERRVFFYAKTPQTGFEPWLTDGSQTGTKMLRDLSPGITPEDLPPAHHFDRPVWSGGKVYFQALFPKIGYELFSYGVSGVAGPAIGGCRGRILGLRAGDPILGRAWTVSGEGPQGPYLSIVLAGKPAARGVPLAGNCLGVLDPASLRVVLDVSSRRRTSWALRVPLPLLAALQGVRLAIQPVYSHAGGRSVTVGQGLVFVPGL